MSSMIKGYENLNIKEVLSGLKKGDYSVRDLVESSLSIISEKDKDIHAFLEVFGDFEDQAKSAQEEIEKGSSKPLLGIPLAIKDNILIEGKVASAGSRILEKYRASYDSTVVKKLKEAGAIFIGRTNMDEFAMGSSTENSAYGPTKNPHDLSRVPGGSSGGSAAAVSMGAVLAALGTDTGGSVRQPASLCGLVGLKPTYGAVSRYGLIALGSSLDQAGPLTKTVTDSETIFSVIRGNDKMDSTSLPDYSYKNKIPKDLKIGVPRSFIKEGIDKNVKKVFEDSIEKFKSLGAKIIDVELPNAEYALSIYYIILPAEVSANLARYDGVRFGLHKEGKDLLDDYLKTRREGFGKEPKRRILLGTYVLSHGYYDAYYNKATALRDVLRDDFKKVFEEVDIIITPTSPTPAFKIGEKVDDPLTMYLEDIFTTPVSLSGVPAISIPGGSVTLEGKELPIGIQLIASHKREDLLFYAGKLFRGEIN